MNVDFFENARRLVREAKYQNEADVLAGIDFYQQEFCGKAAARVDVIAESNMAHTIAEEEAEAALAFLRLFTPANLIPSRVSYLRPYGKENVETYTYFATIPGAVMHGTGLVDHVMGPTILKSSDIIAIRQGGLDKLNSILNSSARSKFQEALLDALTLYSRHTIAKTPSEKLLNLFTALDTFLLKDASEPIQQNIAERLARVVGQTTDERLEIVQQTKKIYGLRSQFVHHGESVEDLEALQRFLERVWKFFLALIHTSDRFQTREAFIEELERQKMS